MLIFISLIVQTSKMYRISEDLSCGIFYAFGDTGSNTHHQRDRTGPQLISVDQEIFRIDKVLRKSKGPALWKGYPEKFNSWIPLKDLEKL